jgi:prevent-host-death family protein
MAAAGNSRKTNIVGAYDAKTHFPELLERVGAGEEFTITKHGHPIATLAPVRKKASRQDRRAAIERIRQLSRGVSLGGLKIRDLINEGRP